MALATWNVLREARLAAERKDVSSWSQFETDDWMLFDWDGTVVTKAQRATEILSSRFLGALPDLNPPPDWKVRVHGDAAVVTYGVKGANPRNILAVFVRQDGRWRELHRQQTPVSSKPTR